MKPINLYFAGSFPLRIAEKIPKTMVSNRLVSYMYPEQFTQWIDHTGKHEGNIIIDSGAFSAWNKGSQIDIAQYIKYAKAAVEIGETHNKKIHIVNLDVIPGKAGESHSLSLITKRKNKDVIELAAAQGYKNLKIMIQHGISPIHVFHQGEDFKWLDRMVDLVPYIGISPANDLSVPRRAQWIELVFEHLYKRNYNPDTHGFAVLFPSVLKRFPWTSCDAATWIMAAGNGVVFYPIGGFSNPDWSKPSMKWVVSEKQAKRGTKNLTQKKIDILTKDGYTLAELQEWQKRAVVNLRYYKGLEKWLNEHKPNINYKPRQQGFF